MLSPEPLNLTAENAETAEFSFQLNAENRESEERFAAPFIKTSAASAFSAVNSG